MRIRVVAALMACLAVMSGCSPSEQVEIRRYCAGPDMVYEAWDRDPSDEDEPQLEFEHVDVVQGDPRCTGATPPPTSFLDPATATIPPAAQP